MPFDTLKNVPQQQRSRITQQDIIPKAVKLRNSDIYSLDSATVLINDIYGNTAITISQSQTAGKVYFGDIAYINYVDGTASFASVDEKHTITEYWLQCSPQWQYSNSANYEAVDGSLVQVNFDDLTDWTVYFEVTGKTDAHTGYFKLYNITDAADIANSEVSTSSTSQVIMRSSAITKPTGTKQLAVWFKCEGGDGATDYVNCIVAKLVVRMV